MICKQNAMLPRIGSRLLIRQSTSAGRSRATTTIHSCSPTVSEMASRKRNLVDPPIDPAKVSSYNAADLMRDASHIIGKLTLFDGKGVDSDDDDDDGKTKGGEKKMMMLCYKESLLRRL